MGHKFRAIRVNISSTIATGLSASGHLHVLRRIIRVSSSAQFLGAKTNGSCQGGVVINSGRQPILKVTSAGIYDGRSYWGKDIYTRSAAAPRPRRRIGKTSTTRFALLVLHDRRCEQSSQKLVASGQLMYALGIRPSVVPPSELTSYTTMGRGVPDFAT